MMRTSFAIAAATAAGFSFAQPAFGQAGDEKLGIVHFETSCTPDAQKLFDRGMLYQHSFWYRASQRVFEDVLKADPECGMAHWGTALSLLWNPHVPPPAKNLAEGAAARYDSGSEPILGEGEGVLPLETLLTTLDQGQERIAAVLGQGNAETLTRAIPFSGRSVSAAQHAFFLYFHDTYHVGQAELLRQLAGKNDKVI